MEKFIKHDGETKEVTITDKTLINQGSFGNIYDCTVNAGKHKHRMVIKEYRSKTEAAEHAKQAFENYKLARDAGLKVLPTFRLSESEDKILMTSGFSEDQICIGSNNDKNVMTFGREYIKNFRDLENFLKNFFEEALKASTQGILLKKDAFFFIVNKQDPAEINFVLGDLDELEKMHATKELERENLQNSALALVDFVNSNSYLLERSTFIDLIWRARKFATTNSKITNL